MTEQYKSEPLAVAHETALGLAEAGVMARRTMKVFDEMCLTPVEDIGPERIRDSDCERTRVRRCLPATSMSRQDW